MPATLRRLKIGIPTETPAADKWVNLTEQLNKQLGHIEDFLRSMPVAAAPATPAVVTPIPAPPFPTTSPTGGGGSGGAAPADASYVTVSNEPGLNNERRLVGDGTTTTVVDGGPNGDIVISAIIPATSLALNVINVTFADSPVAVVFDPTQITYYRGDATGGPIVFNLAHAVGNGGIVAFAKLDGTANALTPTAFAGDNINDIGTYSLDKQRSVVFLADVVAGSVDIIIYSPLS